MAASEQPLLHNLSLRWIQSKYFNFVHIFRQLKFHKSSSGGAKRVAEEEILEIEDFATKRTTPLSSAEQKPAQSTLSIGTFKKPANARTGLSQKSSLANLVRRKPTNTTTSTSSSTNSISETVTAAKPPTNDTNPNDTNNSTKPSASTSIAAPATNKPNALSLLSGYDCSDSDESE